MKEITIKEMCRIMSHIERKVRTIPETSDSDIEEKVYRDIFNQAMRESGACSLDFIKPEYLYAIHEAIDCYELPAYLKRTEGQ